MNEHAFAEGGVGLGNGSLKTVDDNEAFGTGGILFQVAALDFLSPPLPINWFKGMGLLFSVKMSISKELRLFE